MKKPKNGKKLSKKCSFQLHEQGKLSENVCHQGSLHVAAAAPERRAKNSKTIKMFANEEEITKVELAESENDAHAKQPLVSVHIQKQLLVSVHLQKQPQIQISKQLFQSSQTHQSGKLQ